MKGIILAGGSGTRLHPMTLSVSKQLLPIYDKPMVYYPISTLMLAGIREFLLISTPADLPAFKKLLGDGKRWGIQIEYAEQSQPRGLAEAFLIGEKFIGDSPVCLILGDNLFYGQGLTETLEACAKTTSGGLIFGYWVRNPSDYGVAEIVNETTLVSLEEKPKEPKSNYAVPGIYFYGPEVVSYAKRVQPSARGELEITAINQFLLSEKKLKIQLLGRGSAWLDTGQPDALLQASQFVQTVEQRQGLKIGSPEEVAFRKGFIKAEELKKLGTDMKSSEYGRYLIQISEETGNR